MNIAIGKQHELHFRMFLLITLSSIGMLVRAELARLKEEEDNDEPPPLIDWYVIR